jgi:hypothetical protein
MTYAGSATPEGNGEEGMGLVTSILARRTGSGWVQSAMSPLVMTVWSMRVFERSRESVFRSGGACRAAKAGGLKRSGVGRSGSAFDEPVLYVRNDQTGAVRALFTHLEGSDSESLVDFEFRGCLGRLRAR